MRSPAVQSVPAIVLIWGICAGCGDLPRDPGKTTQRVLRERHFRVGIIENPPWVFRSGDQPAGVEVELIRSFASQMQATPDWIWGSEEHHMQALEHYDLDVVIGGLEASTPWKKTVGLTRPYFKEQFTIGLAPNTSPPGGIEGMHVAVKAGDALAAKLQSKHAIPAMVPEISPSTAPAAGPDWRLRKIGLRPMDLQLAKRNHVMATPPGENGWLKRLQEFIDSHSSQIPGLLENQPTP